MDAIRDDVGDAADRGRATSDVDVEFVLSPGLDHRLDERRRAGQAARRTASRRRSCRAATGSGPVPLTPVGALPAVRLPDTRESSRFGSTACKSLWVLPAVPRAVRPLQGALSVGMTEAASTRCAVAAIEPLTDDAVALTFDVPAELRDDYAFTAGQHLADRAGGRRRMRRSYSICTPAGVGRAADRGQAAAGRRLLRGACSTACRSATSST